MVDIQLYNGDCLEIMPTLPEKSIDLIVTDPPYNIGKASWDKIDNYVEWCGKWLLECQRLLKDNGSMYFFHNDMEQIADLMLWIRHNTKFVFKQFIVWDKYNGSKWNQLNALVFSEGLRNYPKQAEYCLFYTFQDETGLEQILPMCFEKYLDYMTNQKNLANLTISEVNNITGYASIASHWFWQPERRQPQPRFIQEYDYKKLQQTGFFKREYEDLRREYEDLRREYESLRYTFNNQNVPSVWNFTVEQQNGHITPKPVDLIDRIIQTSSNENDTVLDCFMGSGTSAIACMNTNRNFIGIEIDEQYFKIAQKRIAEAQMQPLLIERGL